MILAPKIIWVFPVIARSPTESLLYYFAYIRLRYNLRAQVFYLMNLQFLFGGSQNTERDDTQTLCLQNIGPQQQRKRLWFGVWMFAISLVIGVALIALGVNHAWRLLLFFPFAAAATGLFQSKEKT